jgi:hypothetical protein
MNEKNVGIQQGPTPAENYDIIIKKVANGCIVQVGCKTFVFNDTNKAAAEIGAYLKDPVATIKRYKEEYKF